MIAMHTYHHHDGSVAVIAAFSCGTDFTFRTPEFKELMNNICMSLAAWDKEQDCDDPLRNEMDSDAVPYVLDDRTIGDVLADASDLFCEEIALEFWDVIRPEDVEAMPEDEDGI